MLSSKNSPQPSSILTSSHRHFYSRRVPRQHHSSSYNLDKVLKLLNPTPAPIKTSTRVTTEPNEPCFPDTGVEQLANVTRFRVGAALKHSHKLWRRLYEGFENFKNSSSREVLMRHEVEFMNRLMEAIKGIGEDEKKNSRKVITREGKNRGQRQLQAVLLLKENQILKEQLNEQALNAPPPERQSGDQEEHGLEQKGDERVSQAYFALSQQLFHLKEQLCSMQYTNECLRNERGQLQTQVESLKFSNESLCEQIMQFKLREGSASQSMQQWRSIMRMQEEEIGGLKRDQQFLRQEMKLLHHKYTLTLQRINKLTHSKAHNTILQTSQPLLDSFQQQREAFQRVREINRRRQYYNLSPPIPLHDPHGSTYKVYLTNSAALNNPNGVKKQQKQYHQYYKPTFYTLIESYLVQQGIARENFKHVNSSIGINLLCTMRRLLDSKHHEYLASHEASAIISMPTFTLAWLGNWQLNSKTKQLQFTHSDFSLQTVATFYLQLMDERLNANWQVITFRELLLETLTKDEMLFYLKCRFALMKGDSCNGGHYYSQIYWVYLMDAMALIESVVADLDYRKKMEEYLRRSADNSLQNKHMIDGHYILRLLLQYYQFRKNRLLSALSTTFSTAGGHITKHMNFETFLKLFDYNSFSLSLSSKTTIYQQAFSLGRGTVTIDNIFTILNQQGHFCRQAQAMLSKHQQLQQISIKLPKTQQKVMKIQKNFQEYYENAIKAELPSLGLQVLEQDIQRVMKQTSVESLIDRSQLAITVAFLYLKRLLKAHILTEGQLLAVLDWVGELEQKLTEATVVRFRDWSLMREMRKNQASRLIYRIYRRKAYYLGLQSNPNGNKHDQTIRNIKQDFIRLVEEVQSKHSIGKEHRHSTTSLSN